MNTAKSSSLLLAVLLINRQGGNAEEEVKGQLVRRELRLCFIAVPDHRGRFPAVMFLAALDGRGLGQFASLARMMDRAHSSGFDFCGRVTKIKGSKVGLLELRLTPRRGVSPHLRLFGVIRGDTVYLAYGYAKKDRSLDRGVVDRCEQLIADWIADDDSSRPQKYARPRPTRVRKSKG